MLEPTRNAWVALAAWFRRRGARVVLVPPERSADLRDYYHKHTKSDRLDSRLLARLPLLDPEDWRIEYNTKRPHSSLGWLAPAAYAEQRRAEQLVGLS